MEAFHWSLEITIDKSQRLFTGVFNGVPTTEEGQDTLVYKMVMTRSLYIYVDIDSLLF